MKLVQSDCLIKLLLPVLLTLTVVGCASKQHFFTSYSAEQVPLSGELSRMYIYRLSTEPKFLEPEIFVDGKKVGNLQAGGFLVVESNAGPTTITTSSAPHQSSTIFLTKGRESFIRLDIERRFPTSSVTVRDVGAERGGVEIVETRLSLR